MPTTQARIRKPSAVAWSLAPTRNEGNAPMSANVAALPYQVTSMRVAPRAARLSVPMATAASRTSTAMANQSGTDPSMMIEPTPTKNSRRSATGSRTLPTLDTWPRRRAR